jgi:hypothetical protein
VKSRYQTDADRSFEIREIGLDAFDFLVCVLLNIGPYFGGKGGSMPPEFYTLARKDIASYRAKWARPGNVKIRLGKKDKSLDAHRDEAGFELITKELGIGRPAKPGTRKRSEPGV